MVDILKRRQLEQWMSHHPRYLIQRLVNLIAKEIYNDHRYSISYSAGKAIARYQLMETNGNWRNDYTETVFDTKAQATKFLKEKSLDHADKILESFEIEDESDDY
tara:strand:- start:35 stop:349 length:315 start_codon:yes stop_codon:yes gene_type:complete